MPLTRCVTGSGTFRFPVGTDGVYAPVELANVAGTSNFTVTPKSGAYPGPATSLPANRLLRWWELTNGGITKADVTFYYSDSEVVGSENRYRVYRLNQGTASRMQSTLDQNANRATVANVTNFSAWTLAEAAPFGATLSGRIKTQSGRGAERVVVTLTDPQGGIRYTLTNPFGYYRFFGVSTFQTYTVRVNSKRFTFPDSVRMVDFDEFIGNVNFVSTDN